MTIINNLENSLKAKKAVSYIRVSTRGQAERGGENVEGFSLPAQREANKRKASELGAFVVKEFADRGQSAKSADRPQLQAMLKYVKEHKGMIDYLIIHKVDRLARNRGDDVEINRILQEAGVQLVSTSENIDSSPAGKFLHAIMSDIAEFYSNNLANEVMKGLTQKAKSGGTIGRAPLGYKNVVLYDDRSREERTVVLDEERAPLVQLAFQMYSTGDWNLRELANYLAERGLDVPPKPKLPGKQINKRLLSSILRNPYYKGLIKWKGAYLPGSHTPLVSKELWQTVQDQLDLHRSGERHRIHEHYLKSTVYCEECGGRLLIHNAQSRSGEIYPYFVCSNRVRKANNCQHKAILIEDIENKMVTLYNRITISQTTKEELKVWITDFIEESKKEYTVEHSSLRKEKEKLERQQLKLMNAHYEDLIPMNLFKKEQERISSLMIGIDNRLMMHTDYGKQAKDNFTKILEIMEDCNKLYATAPENIKRAFNQAIFEKVLVSSEGDLTPELAEGCKSVIHAKRQNKKESTSLSRFFENSSLIITDFSYVDGLNNNIMVGKTGFEPATPWSQTKCSTKLSYFPFVSNYFY